IEGHGTVKDAKLYPGGARAWDWGETGTRHVPGIQPTDVVELLDHGAATVILSTGVLQALKVGPETLRDLTNRGVTVEVLPTRKAVETYNVSPRATPWGLSSIRPAESALGIGEFGFRRSAACPARLCLRKAERVVNRLPR